MYARVAVIALCVACKGSGSTGEPTKSKESGERRAPRSSNDKTFDRPDETSPLWEESIAPAGPEQLAVSAGSIYVMTNAKRGVDVIAFDASHQRRWTKGYMAAADGNLFPHALVSLRGGGLVLGATSASKQGMGARVVVIDDEGSVRWEKATMELSSLASIVETTAGDVLVVGTKGSSERKLALWRLSKSGEERGVIELWPVFGDVMSGHAALVAELPDGQLLVAGNGPPRPAGEEVVIARIDATGREIWRKTSTVAEDDRLAGLFVDAAGVARVVGHTRNRSSSSGTDAATRKSLVNRPFVLAVRADDGTHLWTKVHEQWSDDMIELRSAIVLADGDIVAAGNAQNFKRPYRAFVARIAPDGSLRWSRAIPPRPKDAGANVPRSRHARDVALLDATTLVFADRESLSVIAVAADGGPPTKMHY